MTQNAENLRGFGRIYKRKRRDPRSKDHWLYSKCWWVQYYHGRQIRRPTHTESLEKAKQFLKKEIGLAQSGRLLSAPAERLKFGDLCQLITKDYSRNQRRSLDRAERAMKHLRRFFGCYRPADISKQSIESYLDYRLDIDHASNATAKYEMSILKRAFHLAQAILGRIPEFPDLRVSNVRKGFFEEGEFSVFLEYFEENLRPPLIFAYLTGWRMKSEILSLQWPQIDFAAGEVRLEPGTTKTDEGRTFPFSMLPELERLLLEQKDRTEKEIRASGKIIPWVFHRQGKKIQDIRSAWSKALEQSKIGKKIPHDFRRTAVRNLERAGVPRSVAMKLVGHRTESIYRRYAIVAKQDLTDGLKRLADYRSNLKQQTVKIFPKGGN